MYIVYIWPTGVAGGSAVPPDVREEPGGALYVHSPPIVLPSTGVPSNGWERPKQAGWEDPNIDFQNIVILLKGTPKWYPHLWRPPIGG